MSDPTPSMSVPDPELLLRHDAWLRPMIRRLVDDGQADDVVQEVFAQALRTPPLDPRALPRWLATVARRVASRMRRGERRRRAREAAVAGGEATAVDPAVLVGRVEERQRIARAVLDLDEPFRTVVLLRWFEDQEPAAIARRLGVPAATVRTRLHRAHEQLRARFERERGPGWRGQLALLCVPLGERAVPAPVLPGARWALLAGLPLAAAVSLWLGLRPSAPPPTEVSMGAVPPPAAVGAGAGDAAREVVASAAAGPGAGAATAPPRVAIRGRVLDGRGAPLAHVPIRCRAIGEPARSVGASDRDGTFAVTLPTNVAGPLEVDGAFTSLLVWQPGAVLESADDALLVAAPRIEVQGRVVDAAGAAVAGARVECSLPSLFGFPEPTAGTAVAPPWPTARSAADGTFRLDGVPGFALADLAVYGPRIGVARLPMPEETTAGLVVVLPTDRPPVPSAAVAAPTLRRVVGSVRDAVGNPIAGAVVFAIGGGAPVASGADGSYAIDQGSWFPVEATAPLRLAFAAPGCDALVREVWSPGADGTAHVDVALLPSQRALTGRIVDGEGHGRAGLIVALADATPLGTASMMGNLARTLEQPAGGAFGASAETDASGAFAIAGVLPRSYRLRVFDRERGVVETTAPVEPGRDVALTLPVRAPRAPWSLQVRDARGHAVAGCDVAVRVVRLRHEVAGATSTAFWSLPGMPWRATTGAKGTARFASLPGGELELVASCPGWVGQTVEVAAGAELRELVLERQCNVRVEALHLDGTNDADLMLRLFDAEGRSLPLLPAWRGSRRASGWSFGVHRGRSMVVGVAASAVRAELQRFDGTVVAAMPVAFAADGVTVLTFR